MSEIISVTPSTVSVVRVSLDDLSALLGVTLTPGNYAIVVGPGTKGGMADSTAVFTIKQPAK